MIDQQFILDIINVKININLEKDLIYLEGVVL